MLHDLLLFSSQLPELARDIGTNHIPGLLTSLLALKPEVQLGGGHGGTGRGRGDTSGGWGRSHKGLGQVCEGLRGVRGDGDVWGEHGELMGGWRGPRGAHGRPRGSWVALRWVARVGGGTEVLRESGVAQRVGGMVRSHRGAGGCFLGGLG